VSIHVSSNLDQAQRICRKMSFYDLVELMTFGKLAFDQPSRILFSSSHPNLRDTKRSAAAASDRSILQGRSLTQTSSTSDAVVYQSWALLEHAQSIDWGYDDASAPSVYIVSTIHALAESLLVSEDMKVFIDRTSRFVLSPVQQQAARSEPMPVFDDGTLTVTLWPQTSTVGPNENLALRLPVDLKTLLVSVLVSSKAPTRFVELVSDVVQRVTRAKVCRASESLESFVAEAAHA